MCTRATLDRLPGMRRLPVLLVACSVAACAQYAWVPDYMTPACAATGPLALTNAGPPVRVERSPQTAPGSLSGTVVVAQRGDVLDHARITLATEPVRAATTDSLGRFALQGVPPGRYAITIRRIGFQMTRDSVTVPREGGVRLAVELEVAPSDGPCSGFGVVRVRKPSWKVW